MNDRVGIDSFQCAKLQQQITNGGLAAADGSS